LDTYEREVDRYGGPDGVSIAEDIFCADSPACMSMLAIGRQTDATQLLTTGPAAGLDRLTVAALSVDALLDSLGYDRHARIRWYRASVRDRRSSGDEYRRRGNALRNLLCEPDSVAGLPDGPALLKALAVRQRLIAPASSRLRRLDREGSLTVPLDSFTGSIVHLHCNRMSARSANEDELIGLLLRTWEGLERSQPGPAHHATSPSNGSRPGNGQ
jgi:thiopeptide-type bacteriocin biosynthesis protein